MLTTQEIIHGFWGDKHRTSLFIPALASVNEYAGQEVLRIACHQPGMPAALRRQRLDEWCHALPALKICMLEIHPGRQDLFEAALRIPGLEALSVGYGPLRSLSPLSGCPTLKALRVESSPQLTGLEALASVPNLRVLDLTNVRLAREPDFVRPLQGLEELHLCGSLWTRQKIDHLWPVVELKQLRSLWIMSVQVLRDGLIPLHQVHTLENLMCDFSYRSSEFEALKAAVPALRYGTPFDERISHYPRLANSK